MKKTIAAISLAAVCGLAWAGDMSMEAQIEKAMNGEHRSEQNISRNKYRHPLETLTFFGVEKGMTVMEIWPGGGWYSEILAPALNGHGQYVAVSWDQDVPDQPGYRYRLHKSLLETFAGNPGLYGEPGVVAYSPPDSASLGDAESVDMVLTFRNTHGWVNNGLAADIYKEFARVLKPGGVLGVVQHRAPVGSDAAETAKNGYVPEDAVIAMATAAGLELEARSEVNANPKDTHDHEFGVWTLPPSLRKCRDIEDDKAKTECEMKWRAIGESDRMTLKFRKPGA